MANSTETRRPTPTFEIDVSPMGIKLNVFDRRTVPHADLIQAMMNAGACFEFGLRASWSAEGGVEGLYRRTPIELENLGEDNIGIINSMWESVDYLRPRQQEALDRILGYYDLFLRQMFEYPRLIDGQYRPAETLLQDAVFQTREAVDKRIIDALANTGGGKFARDVQGWFEKASAHTKRNLRGITNEELLGSSA